MKVVKIELSDKQFDVLKSLSIENSKSISEIVDIAVEQLFSIQEDCKSTLAKIQLAKGIWSDRNDIHDTNKYDREIRKGTSERMKRFGVWDNE